jgi:phage terminase large subunit-like protein
MIEQQKLAKYASDPATFRADLIVDGGNGLARLGEIIEPWQAADFAATDPGWMHCTGRPQPGARQRAYLERPRGHSKTSDLAVMVAWVLAFSPRILRGFAAAADRDQARLIRDAMAKLIRVNPWLSEILDVQNYIIRNVAAGHPGQDSQLEILSGDVGSSYGLLPDFIVADEITHWSAGGEALWHSLISSAAKRPSCMVAVISNAGTGKGDSWQWSLRESARTSPDWHFSRLDGPHASWITEQILNEQQRILPGSVYKRLWLNEWVSGGDALDGADVEACITQDAPQLHAQAGFGYVAGLDLGVKRDHSALVVVGADHKTQRLRLAHCQSWRPPPGGEIDLDEVRMAVQDAHQRFRLRSVLFDPHQAALMAQQLNKTSVPMREFSMAGRTQVLMASTLLEVFRSRRIDLYREPELTRDILRLNIEPRSYGFKLEAGRNGAGHADRAIALAIALTGAVELGNLLPVDLAKWLQVM